MWTCDLRVMRSEVGGMPPSCSAADAVPPLDRTFRAEAALLALLDQGGGGARPMLQTQ